MRLKHEGAPDRTPKLHPDHQLKHTRLATGEEREEEKRQTEQKRQHQKCRLGIKVKIPKKEQKSPNYSKIRDSGEKTATTAALRKASRRIGAAIVVNTTVARTNATEA